MINFENIPLTVTPEFKGGKGEFSAHMFSDELNKIFKGILSPSSSIGMHIHDTSSEIIFILSGIGKVYTGDKVITLNPGDCHYCKKGASHSLVNDGETDLVFYAVVPNQ